MSKQRDVTYAISGKTKGADGYRSPSEHLLDNSGDVVQTEPVSVTGVSELEDIVSEIRQAREEFMQTLSLSVDRTSTLHELKPKISRPREDQNRARESSRISRGRQNRGRSSR